MTAVHCEYQVCGNKKRITATFLAFCLIYIMITCEALLSLQYIVVVVLIIDCESIKRGAKPRVISAALYIL